MYKNVIIFIIFSLFSFFNIFCQTLSDDSLSFTPSSIPLANEFYNSGIMQYKSGNIDSSITLLNKAIETDGDFADAYNKLALIYIEKGTTYSRTLAEKALEKAIELKPDEIMYKINYGKLMIKQGFRYNAKRKFNYVIGLDSTNTDAYLNLGLLYKEDMEYFKNMHSGSIVAFMDDNLYTYAGLGFGDGQKQDGISGFGTKNEEARLRQIDFNSFSREDYKNSLNAFNKVVELSPKNKNALHNLSLLAMEENNFDEFINYQKKILESNPNDKDARLFLGYGYHKKKNDELAYAEYEKAMKLMSGSEGFTFENIDYILPSDKVNEYKKLLADQQIFYRELFWKSKDPLFLTKYNERKLEHYNRMAYANLKFGVENPKIPGWKTDRGKIYIRYGEPKKLVRLRPEILDSGSILDLTEIWYYDKFTFVFEDPYSTGNFKLGGRSRFIPNINEINFKELADYVYTRIPDYYVPEFEGNNIDFDFYMANFRKNKEFSLLEVYYAIPVNKLKPEKDKDAIATTLNKGIFFFDNKYLSMNSETGKEKILLNTDINNKNLYYIGKYQIDMHPGKYNVAVEFQEEISKNAGSIRDTVKIDSFPFGELNASDIVLANNISKTDKYSKFTRDGLEIIPNPRRIFQKNQLIHLYFEIYNLTINSEQKTKYLIEYKVSSQSKEELPFVKRIFSGIGKLFGKKTGHRDIITSYEYEGTLPTEKIYHSIDVSSTNEGFYYLTITVKDLNTNKNISKITRFGINSYKVDYLF